MDLTNRDRIYAKQVNLVLTQTGWTTVMAVGVPYQTINGFWRLAFNCNGTFAATGSANSFDVTVAGVTWSSLGNQTIAFFDGNITNRAADQFVNCFIAASGTTLKMNAASSISRDHDWYFSGDVLLNAKPDFAE